jgi:hypothetical protein
VLTECRRPNLNGRAFQPTSPPRPHRQKSGLEPAPKDLQEDRTLHHMYMKPMVKLGRPPAGLRIRIHFIRIRIQHFRLNTVPIRIQSRSRALMTKNKIKKLQLKFFFLIKTTIYLSLGLHKERPSYKRSLQLSKEAIQHFRS